MDALRQKSVRVLGTLLLFDGDRGTKSKRKDQGNFILPPSSFVYCPPVFVVVRAIAINVNLHHELVLFSVLYGARVKPKTVLAAQQGIDAAQNFRDLTLKRIWEKGSSRLFGKSSKGVVSLQESHPAWLAEQTISCSQLVTVFLFEQVCRSDDVN